jgi:hypothetical protein
MRWNQEKLVEVTGKKTKAAQARWFKQILGAHVPVDAGGVVMCDSAYEALLHKQCGLVTYSMPSIGVQVDSKEPKLRLKN